MAVFMEYITDNEEEKKMIDEANSSMYSLKRWKNLEDKRDRMIASVEKVLKLKYPRLTFVHITNSGITMETDLHSSSVSRWGSADNQNIPKFKCDIQVKDMPDNAEDYMKMRDNIMADKQEIMTAMNYVRFRYDTKAS